MRPSLSCRGFRGTWNLEPGTWNLEPGTWNLEPGTWNALGDDQRLACDRAPTKGSRASKWYVVVLAQNQVLMEPEDIKRIAQAALCETPGKQVEVSLVVRQDSTWIILLRSGEEEWAVKVEESAQSTPESIQLELEAEIRKLF